MEDSEEEQRPPLSVIVDLVKSELRKAIEALPSEDFVRDNSYDEENEEDNIRITRNIETLLTSLEALDLSALAYSTLEKLQRSLSSIQARFAEFPQYEGRIQQFGNLIAQVEQEATNLLSLITRRFPLLLLKALPISEISKLNSQFEATHKRVEGLERD